jgi:hypothetical protein
MFWGRIWTGYLFLELYQLFRNQSFGSGSRLDSSSRNFINRFETNVLGPDLDWIPLLGIIKIVSKPMFWARIWTSE